MSFIDRSGIQSLESIMGIPDRISRAGRRVARDGAVILHQEVEKTILAEEVIASGEYLESIDSSIIEIGDFYEVSIGSTASHAPQVEDGRAPGTPPPIPAILMWMSHVGMEATLFGAMMISKSIGEKGYPGKKIFEKAFESGSAKVISKFDQEFDRAMRD